MKKEQRILPAAMMLFCSGLTMAMLASEAYASDAGYDTPARHKCEARVTKGKGQVSLKKDANNLHGE